jgi:di/tricarboxylate transporter
MLQNGLIRTARWTFPGLLPLRMAEGGGGGGGAEKKEKKEEKISTLKLAIICVGVLAFLFFYFVPPASIGVAAADAKKGALTCAGLLIMTIMFLMTGIANMFALGVWYGLANLFKLGAPADIFTGFYSDTSYFAFIIWAMPLAMSQTGLGQRIGYTMVKLVKVNSYSKLIFVELLLCAILPFCVPSTTANVGILLPLMWPLVGALGFGDRSNVAKVVTMNVAIGLYSAARMPMYGSLYNLVVAGQLATMKIPVTFVGWLLCALVPIAIVLPMQYFILPLILGKAEPMPKVSAAEIQSKMKALPKMSSAEWRLTIYFVGFILAMIASPQLGTPVPLGYIALIVTTLMYAPFIGVLKPRDFGRMQIEMFAFLAFALGLTPVFTKTNLQPYLVNGMLSLFGFAQSNVILFFFVVWLIFVGCFYAGIVTFAQPALFFAPLFAMGGKMGIYVGFIAMFIAITHPIVGMYMYPQGIMCRAWVSPPIYEEVHFDTALYAVGILSMVICMVCVFTWWPVVHSMGLI